MAKNSTVKYSQYEPIVVEDEFGNKYLCINYYEVSSLYELIDNLKRFGEENYDTGDWYDDLPAKFEKFLDGIKNETNR